MPEYKLEPDENLLEYAAKCGVSVDDIWNHANNAGLRRRIGNPWLVGSGETIWVPDECSTRGVALSGKLREFKKKPAPDIVDVYLGFMDEEVNALLAELIKAENDKGDKARPVILVERGQLSSKKPILEWRLGNYPIGEKDSPIRKIIHISPQGMRDATEDEKAPTEQASPEPPQEKIPIPPVWPTDWPTSAWTYAYTDWKNGRDDVLARTSINQIILSDLEIVRKTKRGPGATLSDAPPEPPTSLRRSPQYAKWVSEFDKWKNDTRETARNWRQVKSEWQEETDGRVDKIESLAPEDILASAMGVYMEQSVGEDKKLREKGITFRRAIDVLELIQHRGNPKTKSKLPATETGRGPWLSVVRFDVGPDTYEEPDKIRAPIIVMRTPEMGLQPSLMRPYSEFLLKAISLTASQLAKEKAEKLGEIDREAVKATEGRAPAWDIWEWPLRVYQYGAQGSSNLQKEYRPGKVVHVIASLFVGVDIDREGRTWSLISLCTPVGVYDFHRVECTDGASKADRINRAQESAQSIYRDDYDKLKLVGNKIFFDPASPYATAEKDRIKPGMTLKEAIETVDEIYKDKIYKSRKYPAIITLTVSYFGGEKDKEAADNIGIKGVNMEDYHVIRVLRAALCQGISKSSDYPIVLGGRIDRIQCDPKKIEGDVEEAFDKYIKETNPRNKPHALLTVEDYADIIIWGLKGLLTKEMPDCVRWNFIDHYWEEGDKWVELIKKHFWSFTYNENIHPTEFMVPNPFHIEMATDFLSELTEMNPGIVGVTDEKIRSKIITQAKSVQYSWKTAEKHGAAAPTRPAHQGLPPEVREKEYFGPIGSSTRLKAINLMYDIARDCGFAVIWDDKFLLKDGRMLRPEEITPDDKGRIFLKTWLRPGKWGSNTNPVKAPTTQDLTDPDFSDPKFDAACVDRAFYKSCNMMALQTMAWSVFKE